MNFTASPGQKTKMKTVSSIEHKRGHHVSNLCQPNTRFEQHTPRALQPDRDDTDTTQYNRHPPNRTLDLGKQRIEWIQTQSTR